MARRQRDTLSAHFTDILDDADRSAKSAMLNVLALFFFWTSIARLPGHSESAVELERRIGVYREGGIKDLILVRMDDLGRAVTDDDDWWRCSKKSE